MIVRYFLRNEDDIQAALGSLALTVASKEGALLLKLVDVRE
jgi:hypothetical protein